jgi:transcription initiation factor IIF auxiliary subunit
MKSWFIEIFLLDEAGNEKPATCFTKAVYNLHPSFANPVQSTFYFSIPTPMRGQEH